MLALIDIDRRTKMEAAVNIGIVVGLCVFAICLKRLKQAVADVKELYAKFNLDL
jgi:hypothetical protein